MNSLNRLKKSIRDSLDKIDIFSDINSKDSPQTFNKELDQIHRERLDKSNKIILDDLKQLSFKSTLERDRPFFDQVSQHTTSKHVELREENYGQDSKMKKS